MNAAASPPRPLALTCGEPAGIGAEIALKAWAEREAGGPPFLLLDQPARLARIAESLGLAVPIAAIAAPAEADAALFAEALPVLPLAAPIDGRPGQIAEGDAAAIIEAITRAVRLTQAGETAAVVTNPIRKQSLKTMGLAHPGHTEFLAELAGADARSVMLLASPRLRVVPVTVHVALAAVPRLLTAAEIVTVTLATARALRLDFGIAAPRLAVLGLNPHAGESGLLGREEIEIIAPAIERLKAAGLDVFGPVPPDAAFHAAARSRYDAAICMYHDQALLPLKTLDFDEGVNVTLNLPFVRTSPDHGTAIDIAGTGKANPQSLIAALRLAATMAETRRRTAAS
ncbi:4-hydroxythreonine-4-phosphate dehydrogenase PdxA [Zavarzinia compransoris]|uniref:4-hydroxythreonine-4-phosphate dehydrogenase n=1 Tax=Zavarzinia compransoris TaxID=1264899 RepID=A0A317EAH8_9PROT|nr:4-hydroxythreonine-4-phosphate dehydrogenase PdxA [Zavarzinia compransoris]PWR23681.1 4-hydroxythreonine-4-phosphate dehydrogenase PdxA [Zavarzinia compransoris]TDP47901.1 4-hydroxythreonine-4-phosphate dehydrogenase [Zavarzinia compransoris]